MVIVPSSFQYSVYSMYVQIDFKPDKCHCHDNSLYQSFDKEQKGRCHQFQSITLICWITSYPNCWRLSCSKGIYMHISHYSFYPKTSTRSTSPHSWKPPQVFVKSSVFLFFLGGGGRQGEFVIIASSLGYSSDIFLC